MKGKKNTENTFTYNGLHFLLDDCKLEDSAGLKIKPLNAPYIPPGYVARARRDLRCRHQKKDVLNNTNEFEQSRSGSGCLRFFYRNSLANNSK